MVSEDVRERVIRFIQREAAKPREELAALVRDTHAQYLERIAALGDERAAAKPAPEEWSARELTRHVIATEDLVAALVHHLGRGEAPPPRRGGIGMTMDDDGRPFAGYVALLRETNEKLLASLAGLPSPPDGTMTVPHPWFGELTALQWAAFQCVHDRDHIQHADKILAAIG